MIPYCHISECMLQLTFNIEVTVWSEYEDCFDKFPSSWCLPLNSLIKQFRLMIAIVKIMSGDFWSIMPLSTLKNILSALKFKKFQFHLLPLHINVKFIHSKLSSLAAMNTVEHDSLKSTYSVHNISCSLLKADLEAINFLLTIRHMQC